MANINAIKAPLFLVDDEFLFSAITSATVNSNPIIVQRIQDISLKL